MLLKSIKEVITQIRADRTGTRDVLLRNPADFKLECAEPGTKSGGYRLLFDGNSYNVGHIAVASICRLLKMPADYFRRYPNPREFVEHTHTLMPRVCTNGLLMRLNGELHGVLPGDYRVFDDDQAMEFVGNMASRLLPPIKGVAVTSDNRDRSCYRILFGDSALKRDEIYPVVNFTNSELGFSPLSIDGGTFRLVCTNGSMRSVTAGRKFSWNHFGDFHKKIEDLSALLRQQAQVATETAGAIKSAIKKIVPNGREELARLNQARWISSAFAKDAQALLPIGSSATKYEVFNAITKASQSLRLGERLKTEAVAHAYLLSRN